MSGIKVLLTFKRKRQSRTDPVQGHECRNSLFVAPDDTSLSKPPDLQVHLIDKRTSKLHRNSALYHLQCLDKPHKEKKHIEVSGTRQIPIKTVPTSLDGGKKVGSSSNANAGALVDDNNVGGRQKSSSAAAAFERKSSSGCDGSSPRLNTSNLEDTDSFSRNKLDKFRGDSACVKQVDHPIDYFLPKE
ncbi:unnamed protein product [Prunus armeniaca]